MRVASGTTTKGTTAAESALEEPEIRLMCLSQSPVNSSDGSRRQTRATLIKPAIFGLHRRPHNMRRRVGGFGVPGWMAESTEPVHLPMEC